MDRILKPSELRPKDLHRRLRQSQDIKIEELLFNVAPLSPKTNLYRSAVTVEFVDADTNFGNRQPSFKNDIKKYRQRRRDLAHQTIQDLNESKSLVKFGEFHLQKMAVTSMPSLSQDRKRFLPMMASKTLSD